MSQYCDVCESSLPTRRWDAKEDETSDVHDLEESSASSEVSGKIESVETDFDDNSLKWLHGLGSQDSWMTPMRNAMDDDKRYLNCESGTVVSNITGSQGSDNNNDDYTIQRGTSTAARDPRKTLTEASGMAELTKHGRSTSSNEKRARAGDISHAVLGSGIPERTEDGNPAKTRRLITTTLPFDPFVPRKHTIALEKN
jgi:hypothetical protein